VIDHIEAGKGDHVLRLMRTVMGFSGGIVNHDWSFLIGLGLDSPKKDYTNDNGDYIRGKKDIIKIRGVVSFNPDYIYLIDPNATVKEIHNYEVVRTHHLKSPFEIRDLLKCKSSTCITNDEPCLGTHFIKVAEENYRCVFCNNVFAVSNLEII